MTKRKKKGKRAAPPSARTPEEKPRKERPRAGAVARVLVGAVLLVSGLQKAAAPPEEFAAVIDALPVPVNHLEPYMDVLALVPDEANEDFAIFDRFRRQQLGVDLIDHLRGQLHEAPIKSSPQPNQDLPGCDHEPKRVMVVIRFAAFLPSVDVFVLVVDPCGSRHLVIEVGDGCGVEGKEDVRSGVAP